MIKKPSTYKTHDREQIERIMRSKEGLDRKRSHFVEVCQRIDDASKGAKNAST